MLRKRERGYAQTDRFGHASLAEDSMSLNSYKYDVNQSKMAQARINLLRS